MWTAAQPELKTPTSVVSEQKDRPPNGMANGLYSGNSKLPESSLSPSGRAEGAQLVGIVKRYSSKNGYGFITVEDGGLDCFVHQSEIVVDGFRCLEEGARVQFRHVTRKDKPTATQVRPLPGSRFKVFKSRADAQTKNVQSNDLGHVTGYVKWFDVQKGFGFIVLDESPERPSADVFVHIKEVASQLPLQEGQRVAFELTEEAGGRFKAFNVCALAGQMQYYPALEPFVPTFQPQFTCTGQVRFFNQDRGYGFLTHSDNSPDVYFNRAAILNGDAVKEGDMLGYDLCGNGTKVWAVNAVVLDIAEPLSPAPESCEYPAPLVYPYPYGDMTAPPFAFENVPYDPSMIYFSSQQ